jgi:hypothetical protein
LKAKEFLDCAIVDIALPGRQSDITKQVIFAPGQETLNKWLLKTSTTTPTNLPSYE